MSASQQKHHSFSVEGMTCASCARIVERNLNKLDGVDFVSVNLATHKAYVVSESDIQTEDIKHAVEKAGYTYAKEVPGDDALARQFAASRKKISVALLLTVPLMLVMILHMIGIHVPYFFAMEAVVAGIVLFVAGRSTIKSAFIALRHGHTNMDTLVSVSAFVSWLTAILATAGIQEISFGSIAAMIVAFHLGGRYIEARLKHRAAQDVRSLLDVQARNARLITEQGIEEVPVEAVKPGAQVMVRTGEKIPLDGKIVEGSALVDESMITGEPLPVPHKEESQVIGGTIVQQGSIKVEVEKVGQDTFLSQMIRLVEEAQSSRVPLQALADRISVYFVPAIIVLALLAGSLWYLLYPQLQPLLQWASQYLFWIYPDPGATTAGLFVFVTVLVIACPCALGLATPMALIAGSGKAATHGILIKNGEALQNTKTLKYVLMDKTGTITRGRPQVVETSLSSDVLQRVATVESHSIHPLAAAVVEHVHGHSNPADLPPVENLEETAGEGIRGTLAGSEYKIGKPRNSEDYIELMQRGYTVIEVEVDGRIAGWIAITDPVKAEAREAVSRLHEMGITAVMLTGDSRATARSVADKVGIDEVIAEVTPDRKAEVVRSYRREGYPVGMVGDGINDAAALKTADVGFAVGSGTDLSIESADIVLMQDNLVVLAAAIEISRKTVTTIKQNLFWAFFYNLVALPLAALGFLHPVIAELAMLFSSINVILNSLRISKGGINALQVQRT
ncbi:MAG: heavy metal translocating P-type ATPase [Spirochaetota bacterium]